MLSDQPDWNSITIDYYEKKGTKASVTYSALADGNYIELPMQSYIGYRAKDENGDRVEILRGEGARMRFMVKGDGERHTIYVRYGPVAGFVIANIISALSLAAVIWRILKKKAGGRQFLRLRSHPEKLS